VLARTAPSSLDPTGHPDAAKAIAAAHGSVASCHLSFDFSASEWAAPGSGIRLQGTGGSYTPPWVHRPPQVCDVDPVPCDEATMTFDLGAPVAGDPTRYTLHVSTLFALDDGRLPIPLPGRPEDYRWLSIVMTNNVDDSFYLVFDSRSQGTTQQIATPGPEPGGWALFALGAGLVGAARRAWRSAGA